MNDISYWVSTRCKLIKLIKAGQAYYSKIFSYAWIICCAVEATCKSKKAASSPSRHSDLKIVVCGPTNTNPRNSELVTRPAGMGLLFRCQGHAPVTRPSLHWQFLALLFVFEPHQPDPCP